DLGGSFLAGRRDRIRNLGARQFRVDAGLFARRLRTGLTTAIIGFVCPSRPRDSWRTGRRGSISALPVDFPWRHLGGGRHVHVTAIAWDSAGLPHVDVCRDTALRL